ncbi:putative sorting and assembly machinery (sam50) protein [Schistosoma mansoni]|uniref:putative sorting and assembly machinery (sam50) protein n=1 Tax=Schistosoma mansoni TaxID=6183 RepID=UPI0001A623BC|nr:putative sorting and assembly machinery (sam50) protein [Schistosoma mansoni]|eukprot:XP_018653660.1 putative sorting and assembly machinery (sam50) protein [Schistosoma mansoni]
MPTDTYYNLESIPATVDEVVVSGLDRTHDSIVKKQFVTLVKSQNLRDLFENVRVAKEKLAKLGVFKTIFAVVDVSEDHSKPDAYKITFKVEEKRFVTARMSMTYGTDGITKACGNVRLNNFARRAECADIDVEIGSNQMVSKCLFASYELTTGSVIGRFPYHTSYLLCEIGFANPTAPLGVLKECGSAVKSSLRHVFESDARPDLVFPDSGYLCKISQEIASITPGSQTGQPNCNYRLLKTKDCTLFFSDSGSLVDRALQLKLEGLLQKPFRLCDWLVGEVTFSSGLIHSLSKHPVHISDRFFLGGPLELRGFQWRTVSPSEPLLVPTVGTLDSYKATLDNNDQQSLSTPVSVNSPSSPVGADAFWLTGAHLYTPLPYWGAEEGSLAAQLRLHGFLLAGSTLERPIQKLIDSPSTCRTVNEFSQYFLNELKGRPRTVIGMGIVFRFAGILRVELNYCFPMTYQPGDQVKPGFAFGFGMYYM